MNSDQVAFGLAGAAVVVLFFAHRAVPPSAPRFESAGLNFSQYPDHPGYHWRVPPRDSVRLGLVPSRHRYPTATGGDISALIHHGFSGVRRPSPTGNEWRVHPPSREVL